MADQYYDAIAKLIQNAGLTPGGPGSGFADANYWADKARSSGDLNYFTGRLGKDLAGTGTDQPTGTPGTGPWQKSGQGASTDPGAAQFQRGSSQGPQMPNPTAGLQQFSNEKTVPFFSGSGNPFDELMKYLSQTFQGQPGSPSTPAPNPWKPTDPSKVMG